MLFKRLRRIPGGECVTIPENLDFVMDVDTENARLSEADSKALWMYLPANNAALPGARPAGLS